MPLFVTIRHLSGSLAGKSQRIAMQEGQVLRLGRAESNDIRFSEAQEDSVSGHHAELSLQQGRLAIEDQRSSNGTFLDGAPCPPLQKLPVADGARLRLAQQGPEMQLALEIRPDRPAAGPATPAKESVGKATLLREIEKARTEERGVMQQELTRTRKSGALWVGLGLLLLALLGGWGVSAGLRSNAEKSQEAQARLAAEQKEALGGGGPLSNFLYFDGSLSPGNSGGPVVNDRGQLLGIVTTRFEKPGALLTFMNRTIESRMPIEPSNFAVGPDDIQSFLRQHGLL